MTDANARLGHIACSGLRTDSWLSLFSVGEATACRYDGLRQMDWCEDCLKTRNSRFFWNTLKSRKSGTYFRFASQDAR